MNYRGDAREFLKHAERELHTGDDQRLKYAALELRMAMEALTYDRALSYKDEFPPNEYETWQPRKIMAVLLDINPAADKDVSLAVGIEEEYGVPAPVMDSMGSDKILNMEILHKHYDALGSYLHVLTMKQTLVGKSLDFNKLRSRCEEIVAFVKNVLSSPVFNITLGSFSTIECMECGKKIRKRMPDGCSEMYATCHVCSASYMLVSMEDGKVEWKPHQHEVECANSGCGHKITLWHHEIETGISWICPECDGRNIFVHGIKHEPKGSY